MVIKIYQMIIAIIVIAVVSCQSQPRSTYEIQCSIVEGAAKYHFFLEPKSAQPYRLFEDADYIADNLTDLLINTVTTNKTEIVLDNNGKEYMLGVVVENSQGFYSGMKTAIGVVGISPSKPTSLILIRK